MFVAIVLPKVRKGDGGGGGGERLMSIRFCPAFFSTTLFHHSSTQPFVLTSSPLLKGGGVHAIKAALRDAQPFPRLAHAAPERDHRGDHEGEHAEGLSHGHQGATGPGLLEMPRTSRCKEAFSGGTREHRRPGKRFSCDSVVAKNATCFVFGLRAVISRRLESHFSERQAWSLRSA